LGCESHDFRPDGFGLLVDSSGFPVWQFAHHELQDPVESCSEGLEGMIHIHSEQQEVPAM
jgi:hypothetical protein